MFSRPDADAKIIESGARLREGIMNAAAASESRQFVMYD